MRVVKLGGPAVAGALCLASLASAPAAARPVLKATPRPSPRPSSRPTLNTSPSPKPTPTTPTTPAPRPTPAFTCAPQQGLPTLNTTPWAQQRLGFVNVWKITRGAGVAVAVVDSGVDRNHEQLAGHVTSVDLTHTGLTDCIGHGTAVAGIIGAQDLRKQNMPFVGVAPEARIISVKFTNQDRTQGADPNLPKAVRDAVDLKANVINVSVQAPDTPPLRQAVEYAQRHNVVVVAAAGNVQNNQGTVDPAYPAAYPDVIGVGALTPAGSVDNRSNTVTRVSVSAPGTEVASTWPDGYNPSADGTSFASAFVSGTVALVRAYRPGLDYKQVKRRLEATADGSSGAGSGAGMINPMLAVTALLPGEDGRQATVAPGAEHGPIRVAYRHPLDRETRSIALAVTGILLGVGVLTTVGGVLIPLGRRRGWRPGHRSASPEDQDT